MKPRATGPNRPELAGLHVVLVENLGHNRRRPLWPGVPHPFGVLPLAEGGKLLWSVRHHRNGVLC